MAGKEKFEPTPDEQAMIDRVVKNVEQNITTYTQIMTRASRLGMISHALQEMAVLARNLHDAGISRLGINSEQPLLIVVPYPDTDRKAADAAIRNDPRTIAGEAILGQRINEQILGAYGLGSVEGMRQLFEEDSQKMAGLVITAISGLGTQLYRTLDDLNEHDSLRGHGFAEIQSVDITPLGLNARLVRTPSDMPPGEYGFEVSLADLDTWRLDQLKVVGLDVQENPGVHDSVRMILSGVRLDTIFPAE